MKKFHILDDSLLKIIKNPAFESSTITEICIPKHVKVIDSKLTKVEFVKDSELKIINSDSFEYTSITTIDIPKSVTIIECSAFNCHDLQEINFAEDSKLEFIDCCAYSETSITNMKIKKVKTLKGRPFFGSSIKRLTFSLNLSKLDRDWNEKTYSLINIEIPKNNKNFKMIDNEIIIFNSLSCYDDERHYYDQAISSKNEDDDDEENIHNLY